MHHGPELTVILIVSVALLAGAITRLVSRETRFPYTIAMLLLGIALGFVLRGAESAASLEILDRLREGTALSSDLIIFIFLPALVFESAFALDVFLFRKNLAVVVLLAVPALVLTTVVTAGMMTTLTASFGIGWNWSWLVALVFGALISATDPVAVVAVLRDLGAPKRLAVIIEGESLLNDGTSIVIFSVLLGLLTGATTEFSTGPITLEFVKVVVGGIAVGAFLGFLALRWIARTFNDPLVEITLTIVLAYAAMIVAEAILHVSGVMAVVTAGLMMSARERVTISPPVGHFLHQFWEMLSYVANTLIFFLVGLLIADQIGMARPIDYLLIVAAWAAVMTIRSLVTFLFRPLFELAGSPVAAGEAAVASWGGLRGAVSLALALIVSQQESIPESVRGQILLVTAGIVFLSILVNGTTIGVLLRRFGYDVPPAAERIAQANASVAVLDRVEERLQEARRRRDLRTVTWTEVEQELDERRAALELQRRDARRELEGASALDREIGYWSNVLEVERRAHWSAYAAGTLGPTVATLLDHEVRAHQERLASGDRTPPPGRVSGLGRLGTSIGGMRFGTLSLLYDITRGEILGAEEVLSEIEELGIDPTVAVKIRALYTRWLNEGKERLESLRASVPELATAIETRLARRIELNFEREGYEELHERGALSERAIEAARESIDERMKRLRFESKRFRLPTFDELCRGTPFYDALDEKTRHALSTIVQEMVVAEGEPIFEEGDEGNGMFIIARGAARVVKRFDEEDVVLTVLGGGDIFGEMALLTGEPRTASVYAATPLTMGRVGRADFDRLMRTRPALREQVWAAFAERELDTFARSHPGLSELSAEERAELIRSAEKRVLARGETVPPQLDFLYYGEAISGSEEWSAPALLSAGFDWVVKSESARVAGLSQVAGKRPAKGPDREQPR